MHNSCGVYAVPALVKLPFKRWDSGFDVSDISGRSTQHCYFFAGSGDRVVTREETTEPRKKGEIRLVGP